MNGAGRGRHATSVCWLSKARANKVTRNGSLASCCWLRTV